MVSMKNNTLVWTLASIFVIFNNIPTISLCPCDDAFHNAVCFTLDWWKMINNLKSFMFILKSGCIPCHTLFWRFTSIFGIFNNISTISLWPQADAVINAVHPSYKFIIECDWTWQNECVSNEIITIYSTYVLCFVHWYQYLAFSITFLQYLYDLDLMRNIMQFFHPINS